MKSHESCSICLSYTCVCWGSISVEYYPLLTMFDVSWTDPTRETVGQRKNRKDYQANGLSRVSSIRSSNSNETSQSQIRPSLLNLFRSGSASSKQTIPRSGTQPKLSGLRAEESVKASRRVSNYTVASNSPRLESPPTSRTPSHDFFNDGLYHSDAEQSSASECRISSHN